MEENGAFVNKAEVLDAVDRMEDTILWAQEDGDSEVTQDMALFALRALAMVREDVKKITTYCVTSGGIQRRRKK